MIRGLANLINLTCEKRWRALMKHDIKVFLALSTHALLNGLVAGHDKT